jgi:protein deglycase
MSTEKILVPLAEGFEEVEAIAIVDVLRRAELEVVTAGLGGRKVTGSHGITVEADLPLAELDLAPFTAIVLPGGMPGTRNLVAEPRILELVRRLHGEGRTTAAICAAPLVLEAAGVLEGVAITCHPAVREELSARQPLSGERIVESGSVVTSQGPGTALEFAVALVERLVGAQKASELTVAMRIER